MTDFDFPLTDDEPEMGDFVYNTTVGTIDRVTSFDLKTRYNSTKQCTLQAAKDYGHKVIDINELLTLKEMGKTQMTHTKYSDNVILSVIEEGDYKHVSEAFRIAAGKLGCRASQVASQYYKLRKQGITLDDTKDWSQQDKDKFDPGDPEAGTRNVTEVNRSTSPEGYGEGWKDKIQAQEKESGHIDKGWRDPNYLTPGEREMISKTDSSHLGLEDESDTVINLINPMKTVLVVYTHQKNPLTDKQIRENKLYAFNSPSEVKKGDIIKSDSYNTPMQVVSVLDKPSKYYNRSTGELSDEFTSTEQRELATLVIRDDANNTVYGSVVNKE